MTTSIPAVLITGAAKRLGAAIACAFGDAGWHVVIHCGNSQAEADLLAKNLPSAETIACDLANQDAALQMIDELAAKLDDWRVLVNCAAIFPYDDAIAIDPAAFETSMRINAGTPTRLAQRFFAMAQAKGGRRVINLTDQKIANPNPDFFSYSMSKHAFAAATRMLAMAQNNPADRIYALAPGAILASHDQLEVEIERSHRMNLLGRKTGADEIAAATVFLAEGWLASGETIFLDSGQHLLSQPRDVLFLARQ